jgi:hypothetical protein
MVPKTQKEQIFPELPVAPGAGYPLSGYVKKLGN